MTDESDERTGQADWRDLESAEVYLDAARRRLDAQVGANVALDNRVAASFGVGSTVLPLTIGLLNQQFATVDAWVQGLLAAAIVAYVILLVFSLAAYSLRTVDFRPDIPVLRRDSLTYPSDLLRQWVADEYARSIVVNDETLIQKG